MNANIKNILKNVKNKYCNLKGAILNLQRCKYGDYDLQFLKEFAEEQSKSKLFKDNQDGQLAGLGLEYTCYKVEEQGGGENVAKNLENNAVVATRKHVDPVETFYAQYKVSNIIVKLVVRQPALHLTH